jgi:hypothetical protein
MSMDGLSARGPYSLVVLHKDSFHVPINDRSSWGPDFKASVEEHISIINRL